MGSDCFACSNGEEFGPLNRDSRYDAGRQIVPLGSPLACPPNRWRCLVLTHKHFLNQKVTKRIRVDRVTFPTFGNNHLLVTCLIQANRG